MLVQPRTLLFQHGPEAVAEEGAEVGLADLLDRAGLGGEDARAQLAVGQDVADQLGHDLGPLLPQEDPPAPEGLPHGSRVVSDHGNSEDHGFLERHAEALVLRQAEKDGLNKRLAETEHMALQAQMNPHFIFNCLNSIQQYIFDQDILAANKYITGFAKLIRATLHHSTKTFISLADEIDYLSAYLSLEKLRFKEKMNYTIDVEPVLRDELENIHIPPMLIQPYVENSMRHGLRHRKRTGGYIRINIIQEGNKLTFVIEDNGIGREQAARYKTREHIEYQSKGMSLTADRVRLINDVNGDSIRVEVIDLVDREGGAEGTRVIVRFPRFDLFLQKNSI